MNYLRILKAGVIVGTLDIIAACAQFVISTGKNPDTVLKFIASGILGKDAFSGGVLVSLTGLVLHYLIAFLFTFFFFWLASKSDFMKENKLAAGILYGVFTWIVMSQLIVPLSSTPPIPFSILGAVKAAAILIVCLGIPLAYLYRGRIEITPPTQP